MDSPHPPRREYSIDTRNQIVGAHKMGASNQTISDEFKIPKTSIRNIISRWKIRGTVADAPRSGRPRKTTPRDRRHVVLAARKDQGLSVKKLTKKIPTPLSEHSVRRILAEKKMKMYKENLKSSSKESDGVHRQGTGSSRGSNKVRED
ncbi:hypothetical protein BDN72DRAFT_837535 [Pluteus cervinus]|uniref:Uncharacterized protein n=1 Tax=Pluteus cervinus TaxID=181527 RepID=A0ACD3AZQ3_9AGAR|nr:hypothetical protein BDN72DRAFT_837535 [Pluteus cervinus]